MLGVGSDLDNAYHLYLHLSWGTPHLVSHRKRGKTHDSGCYATAGSSTDHWPSCESRVD